MGPPDPRRRIGRYRVLSELGRGSMARVYRALDPNLEREIALKVLAPATGLDDGEHEVLRRRFLQEARAAGRLRHPGIVLVLDADTDPESGAFYIAMELVEGRSLDALLRERGRFSVAEATDFGRQVLAALDYAHGEGVVHRDIKPANLLVPERGPLKVSDFGVAKLGVESLTLAGQILGSPGYMAPEQVLGTVVDGRADLFSVGAVLYRCLAGEPPFGGDSIASVTFKVVHVDPRPLRSANPEVPPAIEAVLEKALAKDAADRYPTGREMAAALESAAAAPVGGVATIDPPTAAAAGETPTPPADDGVGGDTVVLADSPAVADERAATGRRLAAAVRAHPRTAGGVAAVLLLGLLGTALWLPALRPSGTARRGAISAPPRPPAADRKPYVTVTPAPSSQPSPPPPIAMPEVPPPLPASEPAPSPKPKPAPPPATLDVTYLNRLRTGWMTVWVDGKLRGSWPLRGPGNVFRRVAGSRFSQRIEIPPGNHRIEVRIEGGPPRVAARQEIEAEIAAGAHRSLRVVLNPLTENVKLRWME